MSDDIETVNEEAPPAEVVMAEVEDAWARDDAERELGVGVDEVKFADWYVGKVLALEAELTLLADQHERRLRALIGRLAGVKRYGSVRAEAYLANTLKAKHGRGKFLDLPHGRLGFRAKAATVDYGADKERVRHFAETYGPAAEAYLMNQPPPRPEVRIKVLTAAVEQWIADHNGEEVPPGFLYIGEHDAVYVAAPK